ncbi:M1 family peptidase, partial [Paenibacillus tundrae]|nr:M1 family peptidase [Paenibacillus tundrae]
MNHSRSYTSNRIRITAISALAMILTACPIISTGSAAANAAPVSAISQATKDIQAQAPIQYRIQARLDEKKMTIEGSESITYRNTSKDTLKQLVFHTYADANLSESTQTTMFKHSNEEISKNNPDKKPEDFLGGIDIEKVTTGGQALDFSNKDQAMSVKLEQPLQPGESVTVQVHFNLKIPYGSQRLSYYKDIINGAHWFPVMSVYDEAKHEWDSKPYSKTFETDYYTSADYEVQFNVPDQYQVVMPGTITTREDAETGRK